MTFVWIGLGVLVVVVYVLAVSLAIAAAFGDAQLEQMKAPTIVLRYDVWQPSPFPDCPLSCVRTRVRYVYEEAQS